MSCCSGATYSLISQIFAHPLHAWKVALGLRDESRCGDHPGFPWVSLLPLSLGTGRVTLVIWLSFFLPFLFALDPFPEVQDASNMCPQGSAKPTPPSCGPQRMATHLRLCPPGPCISFLQLLEVLKTREASSLPSGGQVVISRAVFSLGSRENLERNLWPLHRLRWWETGSASPSDALGRILRSSVHLCGTL